MSNKENKSIHERWKEDAKAYKERAKDDPKRAERVEARKQEIRNMFKKK
nr:hypothetical protein [Mammaliicoccus sp. Marseille-Q6498]